MDLKGTGTVGPNTATVAINNAITLGDLSVVTAGNPSVTLTSGDLTISGTGTNAGGNINMTQTTLASAGKFGVYNISGNRFMYTLGANQFEGINAGNFAINTAIAIDNLGVGQSALLALTAGIGNTIIGKEAGLQITSGQFNTAVGKGALDALTTGSNNLSLGHASGSSLTAAESNQVLINHAGCRVTIDRIVIANGSATRFITTDMVDNFFIGIGSGNTTFTTAVNSL